MQFRNLFALIASAASLVAAQNVVIHMPVPGISATPGESFLVDIELPVRPPPEPISRSSRSADPPRLFAE